MPQIAHLTQIDTDTLLAMAASRGNVSLYLLDSGWNFTVEIPAIFGDWAIVHSRFGCTTAREAIIEVLDRVNALKENRNV